MGKERQNVEMESASAKMFRRTWVRQGPSVRGYFCQSGEVGGTQVGEFGDLKSDFRVHVRLSLSLWKYSGRRMLLIEATLTTDPNLNRVSL